MHCAAAGVGRGVGLAEAEVAEAANAAKAEAEAAAAEAAEAEAAEAAEVAEVAEVVREVRLASPSLEAGLPCPALPSAIPAPRPVRQAAQTSASLASDLDRASRATTASATTSSGHSPRHSRASSAGSAAAIGLQATLQPPGLPLAAFVAAGGKSAAEQLHGTRAPADAAGAKGKAALRGQQGAHVRERGGWRLVHRAVMRAPRNR